MLRRRRGGSWGALWYVEGGLGSKTADGVEWWDCGWWKDQEGKSVVCQ